MLYLWEETGLIPEDGIILKPRVQPANRQKTVWLQVKTGMNHFIQIFIKKIK